MEIALCPDRVRVTQSPGADAMAKKKVDSSAQQKSSSKASIADATGETGSGGELHQRVAGKHPALTTNQGLPIADNQNSLLAAPAGPTLLEDFILREKITHFDHERIPERIVHARGSAAHGYFELSRSLKKYTSAKVLTEVGVRTPLFARFSTVAGGSGSVDTPRDVRGFAVKFYTSEGNWDLVGNDIPVFFIQDAIKFPDLIHSVKMEPDRGFPQAASAHDTFWDFISLTPESMHMIMWAMSDRALPRSLRMIEGFGIHSFRLINANGDSTFVKYHWRPKLGLQSTLWDEAVKIAGADPDFHRRDLFEAIQSGAFPEWELAVQLFTEDEAKKFPFDHLDATKLIPEELVPLTVIGRMVLDRWPDNFFAETEQVAFCPSHILPGMDFSEDPLLQGRLFSYLDTQLSRLGSANFHQLPINKAKCPFANQQRDAHMQMDLPKGRVSYEPSTLDPTSARESMAGFKSAVAPLRSSGKQRARSPSFADHYSQARMFFRSQSDPEQAHIVAALIFELSKVETPHIRMSMLSHLLNIDSDLAARVGRGLGVKKLPAAHATAAKVQTLPPSAPLQLIGKMKRTLNGRCVGLLFAQGSDTRVIETLRRALKKEGAQVKLIAPTIGGAELSNHVHLAADCQLAGSPSVLYDAVAIVLSAEGAKTLAKEAAAIDFIRDAFGHLKAIAVDKSARDLLKVAGVEPDAGICRADDLKTFIAAASTRQWQRESSVRTVW
jgi:catalase